MNTKLIMTLTAVLMAIIGLSLNFAPDQVALALGMDNSSANRLILQLLGAAYYGFAIFNWMAKGSIIGGIYNRPLATGNFAHFLVAGLALGKAAFGRPQLPLVLLIVAGCYVILACVFGIIFSRHPGKA